MISPINELVLPAKEEEFKSLQQAPKTNENTETPRLPTANVHCSAGSDTDGTGLGTEG
jgi:hypothetical protein